MMLTKRSRMALIAAAACLAVAIVPSSAAHAGDLDCAELGSQEFAQSWFLDQGGPDKDPDGLDPDGDGLACETNPPPYGGLMTLEYKAKRDKFKGSLTALFGCHQGRAVTLFKRVHGPDKAKGSTTTNARGRFSIKKTHVRRSYYVIASERGSCGEDRSLDVFL